MESHQFLGSTRNHCLLSSARAVRTAEGTSNFWTAEILWHSSFRHFKGQKNHKKEPTVDLYTHHRCCVPISFVFSLPPSSFQEFLLLSFVGFVEEAGKKWAEHPVRLSGHMGSQETTSHKDLTLFFVSRIFCLSQRWIFTVTGRTSPWMYTRSAKLQKLTPVWRERRFSLLYIEIFYSWANPPRILTTNSISSIKEYGERKPDV
jgi:hypothetical protein